MITEESKDIISLNNVSKIYKLYSSSSHRMLESFKFLNRNYSRDFWALKEITFSIPRGATVGILGQNGSGKSTLLQLITSVLKPSLGEVHVTGRIAALLELGAGFNPRLSGRENVILNGIILGMSKDQVLAKMGKIQEFADIGDFFDQPMRLYSSGMFMRVAFAAAIHVDPDILIIDEALSVGDAKFQEKCFRRFREFQDAGKTILLVTHDRTMVPRLCDLALLLHQGRLIDIGEPKKIVDLYSNILATGDIGEREGVQFQLSTEKDSVTPSKSTLSKQIDNDVEHSSHPLQSFLYSKSSEDRCASRLGYNKNEYRYGDGRASIIDYLILGPEKSPVAAIRCNDKLEIYIKILAHEDLKPLVGLSIRDTQGILVCGLNSDWLKHCKITKVSADQIQIYKFTIRMNLRPGPWFIEFAIAASQAEICDIRSNIVQIDVIGTENSFDGLVFLENNLEVLV